MVTAGAGAAFDPVAASYDACFTDRMLGHMLRERVQSRLAPLFAPGRHVLELGCGTGEDALWLARRGVRVTATDASPAMLAVARERARVAGADDRITFARLALGAGPLPDAAACAFDGALADFGVLNCVPDRIGVARMLAERLRPGAHAVLVLMGPLCGWEIGWHLVRGRPAAAVRRFRRGAVAHLGNGATARVWYPSARRLRAEFRPWFRHVTTVGIGILLPPSYLVESVERRPRLLARLGRLEDRIAGRFPWRHIGDHYLLVLERR